jgi:hypothetical protein
MEVSTWWSRSNPRWPRRLHCPIAGLHISLHCIKVKPLFGPNRIDVDVPL